MVSPFGASQTAGKTPTTKIIQAGESAGLFSFILPFIMTFIWTFLICFVISLIIYFIKKGSFAKYLLWDLIISIIIAATIVIFGII